MKTLTGPLFANMIGAVLARIDNAGFRRVWGYLVDDEQRTVTFWRHKQEEDFQFKILETYVVASPLSEMEDRKQASGYSPIDLTSAGGRRLLSQLRCAYQRCVEAGEFHFTAPPR